MFLLVLTITVPVWVLIVVCGVAFAAGMLLIGHSVATSYPVGRGVSGTIGVVMALGGVCGIIYIASPYF